MIARIVMDDGSARTVPVTVVDKGDKLVASLSCQVLPEGIAHVDFMPDYLTADSGDDGYMVIPVGLYSGTILCRFRERDDAEYAAGLAPMPVFGMRRGADGMLAIATGMATDFRVVAGVRTGRYYLYPRFILGGDAAYEDIVVAYYRLPGADYADMARRYRQYQLDRGACVPLRDRVRERPALRGFIESMEVRIRQGWKPAPSPIPHQTPENQPPMKVVCDFDRVGDIVDEFHRQGIDNAEFCLVGWNHGGHDGCFPQHFPVEKTLGGEEALRALTAKAKALGYAMVCHSNSTGAYECADCWDEDDLCKDKKRDGSLGIRHASSMPLSGGEAYMLCPQPAYERFAVRDLPRIADLGFAGMHYIDVLTAGPARTCHDPSHSVNRRQCSDWYNRIGALSRELFGGFQSEGPYDFMSPTVDFVLYTSFNLFMGDQANIFGSLKDIPVCDDVIPFFQLVYHGIIASNPGAETVNYVIKNAAAHLKFIEYGGRPAMYYYSKFVDEKNPAAAFGNWMGKTDLTCDTDEELRESVILLKKAYDEYEALSYLQYEYMEKHEKLDGEVYRVTYSDGTVITVDYDKESYEVKKP